MGPLKIEEKYILADKHKTEVWIFLIWYIQRSRACFKVCQSGHNPFHLFLSMLPFHINIVNFISFFECKQKSDIKPV